MSENLNKKPPKGILKQSSSFDKPGSSSQACFIPGSLASSETITPSISRKSKSTKFDEMNIIETLHPPDKDYGHMKIEEPKTPFNYYDDAVEAETVEHGVDPGLLQSRLQNAAKDDDCKPSQEDEESDEEEDEDGEQDPEALAKRHQFESKRKAHYNEYYAVKLARKLLEQEEDEEDIQEEDSNESRKGFVPNEELDAD